MMCPKLNVLQLPTAWSGSRVPRPTARAATAASTTTCCATASLTAPAARTKIDRPACSTKRRRPTWTCWPTRCCGGRAAAKHAPLSRTLTSSALTLRQCYTDLMLNIRSIGPRAYMRSVKAANSQECIRAQPVITRTCVERNETYQVVVQPMPKHDHLKCSVRFPTATIETTDTPLAANEGSSDTIWFRPNLTSPQLIYFPCISYLLALIKLKCETGSQHC